MGVRVSGLDRYRAVLAHMAGHRRWSSSIIADNYSPFQRMAVEFFEDCRIETLLVREYPGLRRIFLALHPFPGEADCDPETTSCLRHRLAMLSRALLDPQHSYANPQLLEFTARCLPTSSASSTCTCGPCGRTRSNWCPTRRPSTNCASRFPTTTS